MYITGMGRVVSIKIDKKPLGSITYIWENIDLSLSLEDNITNCKVDYDKNVSWFNRLFFHFNEKRITYIYNEVKKMFNNDEYKAVNRLNNIYLALKEYRIFKFTAPNMMKIDVKGISTSSSIDLDFFYKTDHIFNIRANTSNLEIKITPNNISYTAQEIEDIIVELEKELKLQVESIKLSKIKHAYEEKELVKLLAGNNTNNEPVEVNTKACTSPICVGRQGGEVSCVGCKYYVTICINCKHYEKGQGICKAPKLVKKDYITGENAYRYCGNINKGFCEHYEEQ